MSNIIFDFFLLVGNMSLRGSLPEGEGGGRGRCFIKIVSFLCGHETVFVSLCLIFGYF